MVSTLTVLAHLGPDGSDLPSLVGNIDGQTLPHDAFDVVYLLDDVDPAVRRRIEELAVRRPNVQVQDGQVDTRSVVKDSRGEWLLYLSPAVLSKGAQLPPRAFERLLAYAAAQDGDVVIGRADVATNVNDLFAAASPGVVPEAALLDPFPVMYRRDFAAEHGLVRDEDGARAV